MKKKILIVIGMIFLLLLFSKVFKHNTVPTINVTEKGVNFSAEKETEIYYRFYEIYHEVTEKEGVEVLPETGQKEWKTPKKDKAIQITADEYNIPISQVKAILEKIEKRKPTDEELKIFQLYDDRLNKAIDVEASGGELINEDKIRQEVAGLLGISQQKLRDVWDRVFVWQEDN
jgi:hypothetical protein